MDGAYTQESTGTLAMELDGIIPGTKYDQLLVTGAAALDGSLDVTLLGEFTPAVGQSFTIMTYASRTGVFEDISLPPVASDQEWTLEYGDTALVLSLGEKDEINIFLPLFIH